MSSAERAFDSAPSVLDIHMLRDVRARIAAAGLTDHEEFVVVAHGDRGLTATVVDAETGTRLVERTDDQLEPRSLDLAVVDHLIRTGRVTIPESDEWAVELRDVVTGLRETLVYAEGSFAMGTEHVGLVRVSRRDLVVALHPQLMAATALWQSVASERARPVGAVVFLPGHQQWPGLFETVAQHAAIPTIAVEDAPVATVAGRRHGRHGVPAGAAEPVVPNDHDSDDRVSDDLDDDPGHDVAVPEPSAPASIEFQAPEFEPTPVFESMSLPAVDPTVVFTPSTPSPHPTPTPPPPVMHAHVPVAADPDRNRPSPAVPEQDAFNRPVREREPISVHDHRDMRDLDGPRHYSPPAPVAETASPEARRVHQRRLLIGAGAVAGAAALGIVVLTLPWLDQGESTAGAQINVAQTGSPPVAGTSQPSSTQAPRTPLDLGAARLPVTQYTAPPPPPPTVQAAPRRANPAPRPRLRSIPNPIPGLPPILLP